MPLSSDTYHLSQFQSYSASDGPLSGTWTYTPQSDDSYIIMIVQMQVGTNAITTAGTQLLNCYVKENTTSWSTDVSGASGFVRQFFGYANQSMNHTYGLPGQLLAIYPNSSITDKEFQIYGWTSNPSSGTACTPTVHLWEVAK